MWGAVAGAVAGLTLVGAATAVATPLAVARLGEEAIVTAFATPDHPEHGFAAPVLSADGRTLTLSYVGGGCDVAVRAEAEEGPGEVQVQLVRSQRVFDVRYGREGIRPTVEVRTGCTAMGYHRSVSVRLARPLGDRVVVDASRAADGRGATG